MSNLFSISYIGNSFTIDYFGTIIRLYYAFDYPIQFCLVNIFGLPKGTDKLCKYEAIKTGMFMQR